MKKIKYLLLILTLCLATSAFSQQRQKTETKGKIHVSGKVTDKSGKTIPGVTIVVKGTTTGTITDLNGHYSLSNVPANATLSFSYVGMKTTDVKVDNHTTINITLVESATGLNEVVVVGYGTMKKEDLTSAIASVPSTSFVKGAVKDAGQLLQGKVAGLEVTNSSGDPTAGVQISLRGTTSLFGANTSPLVLIDGIPGNLNTVAPEDIKSISVLKGGSAAAIYGSRASNGVILITTKSASGHYKNRVDYSSYYSTQSIYKKLNILTAADYRQQIKEGIRSSAWDLGHSQDWLKLVTRVPFSQVQNLTIHGGNNKTNYVANINYKGQQGIFKKSNNKTLRARIAINHEMFDGKLKLHFDILNTNNSYTTTADGSSFNSLIYRYAVIFNPTSPIRNSDGSYFQQPGIFEYSNPLAIINTTMGQNTDQNTQLDGELTYHPIKHLVLKGLVSYEKYNQTRNYMENKDNISAIKYSKNGYASDGAHKGIQKLLRITGTYSNKFGNSDFTFLGGYSYQDNLNQDFYMQNYDFSLNNYLYDNMWNGDALKQGLASMGGYENDVNLISFFSRATYSYKNTYLLMASMRYEAASQLYGTKEPWGAFPAVSAGWRITNMPFMKHLKMFDNLKLRVGYGVTGNQPSALFLGVAQLSYGNYVYSNGKWISTLVPSQNPNPNLKWEEKKELDAGLDFSMFNGKISGSVDYYIRHIDGLLYTYSVPSPPNLYPSTEANVGKMENQGLEVTVNVTPIHTHNFEWNSTVTFSHNSNKVLSLSNNIYKTSTDYFTTGYTGDPIQTFTNIVKVGQPIGDFYGYKVVGVTKDGYWIYLDKNGNKVPYQNFDHSFANKRVLGNGIPKYYAGWNNTFSYKHWSLGITMRGAFGFQILNTSRMYYENPGITDYNRLKSAYNKVFGTAVLNKNVPLEFNSYYIENGDYWKIDNVTLGYQIPVKGIKYIHSARVYASCLNTLIISGYKGIDPEVSTQGATVLGNYYPLAPGVDNRDKYPTTRVFTFGINVDF